MSYDPSDWYWAVASDATRVWSSKQAAYVPVTDAAYVAWLDGENQPTHIASEAELFDVLTEISQSPGTLGSVAQQAQRMLTGSTVTVSSSTTPALNGTYAVNPNEMLNITGLQAGVAAGALSSGVTYTDASNVEHSFTGPQFTTFATAYLNYVVALTRCARGNLEALPPATLSIP